METIQYSKKFQSNGPLVATIGMFDGVHLGHQQLLSQVVKKAQEMGGSSALFSFDQHPRIVLYQDDNIELLTPENEKVNHLEKTLIDYYIPLHFTENFAQLSAFEFVRDILVNQYNVQFLLVGHDHHFGKNREGSFEQLEEYSHMFEFQCMQFPAVDFDGKTISSTKIRNALHEGNVHTANAMLGYDFELIGKVVQGKSKGKLLGFPTANIVLPTYKLIPKKGVYIAEAALDTQFYEAMVNIGTQPTLTGKQMQIEAHLLNFSEEIYEKNLTLRLKKYLREEEKFESQEALKNQLLRDREKVKLYFNSV